MRDAARWTRVGTLAAFALLLGYVETFVPIPIPGVKLGLANVAVLAELGLGDISGAACIACIKVLASGFLFGSPLTMAYSAAGTALAFAGMAPLSRLRTMRLWMLSIVGAILHEIGQLVVAQAILQTNAVWYTLPILMTAGCITGTLCGFLAESLRDSLPTEEEFLSVEVNVARLEPRTPRHRTLILFVCLLTFAIVVLHLTSLTALAACTLLALIPCLISGASIRSILRILPLLASVFLLTFALQFFAISADVSFAMQEAGRSTLRLASLALSSEAFAKLMDTNELTGTLAWLLLPLSRIGARTQGFVLAFDVAIRLVPVLSETVQKERLGLGRLGLRTLRQRLPNLVHEVCLRAAQLN